MEVPVHHLYTVSDEREQGEGHHQDVRVTSREKTSQHYDTPVSSEYKHSYQTSPALQRKERYLLGSDDINRRSSPLTQRRTLQRHHAAPSGYEEYYDFIDPSMYSLLQHNSFHVRKDDQFQITSPLAQRKSLQQPYSAPSGYAVQSKLPVQYNSYENNQIVTSPGTLRKRVQHQLAPVTSPATIRRGPEQTKTNEMKDPHKVDSSPQTLRKGIRVRFIQRPKADGDSSSIDKSNIHVYMIKHHQTLDPSSVEATELLPEAPQNDSGDYPKERVKKIQKHVTFNDSLNSSQPVTNIQKYCHNRTMRLENPDEYWENRERKARERAETEEKSRPAGNDHKTAVKEAQSHGTQGHGVR